MTTFEKAIRHFGLTDNPYEAGFILPDGKMLDFSGKRQGGSSGMHHLDHSEVSLVMPYGDSLANPKFRFTRLGAVRFFLHPPRYGGSFTIAVAVMPTPPQLAIIAACLKHASYLAVDVYNLRGRVRTLASNSWEPPPTISTLYQWLVKTGGLQPLEL